MKNNLKEHTSRKDRECYFCKEKKEVGKEVFWCPRLRTSSIGNTSVSYYGHWTCLACCENSFFNNMLAKHLDHSWMDLCGSCDFPVGAILKIRKMCDEPDSEWMIFRQTTLERSEKGIFLKKHRNGFIIHPDYFPSYSKYLGFKWDKHKGGIKVISKQISDGVVELVINKRKLPIRKVILLEDTLSFEPLTWWSLKRYYWSQCGYSQHSKDEKWMDNAPVIIAPLYINKDGASFDKNMKKRIEIIRKLEFEEGKKNVPGELNES